MPTYPVAPVRFFFRTKAFQRSRPSKWYQDHPENAPHMLNGWANIPPTLRGDGAGKVQPKGHMTPTCPCNSHVHLAENRVLANFMVITPRNQGWVGDLHLFGTIRGMGLLTCIKVALKWRSSWGWFSNATPKGRPKGIIPDQMTTDIYIGMECYGSEYP